MNLKHVFGFLPAPWLPVFLVLCLVSFMPVSSGAAPWALDGIGAIRQPKYTEEGSKACLHCHFGESVQAIAKSPHGNTQNPHTPYGQKGCESCHGPGSFHVSRAYGGTGMPKLITFGTGAGVDGRQEQLFACLKCHEEKDNGSPLIGFSGSVHDVSPVNCSSCHEVHTESERMTGKKLQAETCLVCHDNMRNEHPRLGRKQVDIFSRPCSNCHRIHPPKRS